MDFVLLIILIEIAEFIFLISYGIVLIVQLHKRSVAPHSLDLGMQYCGRLITWSAVIGSVLISKGVKESELYVVFSTVLLACYFVGSRLWLRSYIIMNESKDFLYALDQWLIRMYRRYLEPLGK